MTSLEKDRPLFFSEIVFTKKKRTNKCLTRFGKADFPVSEVKGTMVTGVDETGGEIRRDRGSKRRVGRGETRVVNQSSGLGGKIRTTGEEDGHIVEANDGGEDDPRDGGEDDRRDEGDIEHGESVESAVNELN